MSLVKFITNSILTGILLFATYESSALNALDVNYPSIAQLKLLQLKKVRENNDEQKMRLLAQTNKRHKK